MKKIHSCTDGYPSCRKAEANGEFCVNKCEAAGKMTDTNTKEIKQTPEPITDAYNQGKEAFLRGDDISLNPYDDRDAQFDDWRGGWMDEYVETK